MARKPNIIVKEGQKFNNLTIIKYVGIINSRSTWNCKCDCGNYKNVKQVDIVNNKVKSCGCLKKITKNLLNQRFGRLFIKKFNGENKIGQQTWLCVCDCSNVTVVSSQKLLSQHTQSCGCLHYERLKSSVTKHGLGNTKIYSVWIAMIQRCRDHWHANYKNYGGRGIKVCDRWSGQDGFENFLEDMGECPEGLSIHRTNNNGNYCKENCVWADRIVQNNATRKNRILELNNEKLTLAQWSRKTGINVNTIVQRIDYLNWPLEEALTKEVRK